MEKSVFDYEDYKQLLADHLASERARGELTRLARMIGVHRSRLTRMVRGPEHPSHEQAFLIATFLGLDEESREYFVTLVDLARSTSRSYREFLLKKLAKMRMRYEKPLEMVPLSRKLSAGDEYVLNSNYLYVAVWLLSMNPSRNSLETIADDLEIAVAQVEQIAGFLCNCGFCRLELGRLSPEARKVEFTSKSRSLNQFLTIWRQQGLARLTERTSEDFFQSEPMSIGRKAYAQIRAAILVDLQRYKQILASDRSEIVACLNIDLFQISSKKT